MGMILTRTALAFCSTCVGTACNLWATCFALTHLSSKVMECEMAPNEMWAPRSLPERPTRMAPHTG
eukprot:6360802-Alexandrium_andersonii.AAC.1